MGTFLDTLKEKNEALFFFGACMLAGALVMVFLIFLSSRQVMGINAYVKPMKFFLSTWLLVWSMGWYLQFLDNTSAVRWFSWVTILGLGYEMLIICLQAFRGKQSHFNIQTPVDHALFTSMGLIITIFTLWLGYVGILFFRQSQFTIPDTWVWGIRLGIMMAVIFAFEGGLMGSRLQHGVGGPDGGKGIPFLNWSTTHGDLRVAHFLGLHALQIIPLFAVFIARNITQVVAFATAFLLLALWVLWQALSGKPLLP